MTPRSRWSRTATSTSIAASISMRTFGVSPSARCPSEYH